MKDKPKQGWIKELAKPAKTQEKKPFGYTKPVNKLDKPNGMALNYRNREFKAVRPDKTTNFAKEQTIAKSSHKGRRDEE